jgi:hypothetical protein
MERPAYELEAMLFNRIMPADSVKNLMTNNPWLFPDLPNGRWVFNKEKWDKEYAATLATFYADPRFHFAKTEDGQVRAFLENKQLIDQWPTPDKAKQPG